MEILIIPIIYCFLISFCFFDKSICNIVNAKYYFKGLNYRKILILLKYYKVTYPIDFLSLKIKDIYLEKVYSRCSFLLII